MKVMIDIPEETYNKMRRGEKLYPADANVAIFAIEMGNPIDECKDCVSRQEALSHARKEGTKFEQPYEVIDADVIRSLPPVVPEQTFADMNMTNGEVFNEVFTQVEYEYLERENAIRIANENCILWLNLDWWKAPYDWR